jgi:hypothetical protein
VKEAVSAHPCSEAMYSTSTTAPAHVVHPSLTRGGRGETGPSGGLGGGNVVHANVHAAAPASSAGSGGGHWGAPSHAYGGGGGGGGGGINTVGGGGGGMGMMNGGFGNGNNGGMTSGGEMGGASAEGVRRRQNQQPVGGGGLNQSYQPTPLGLASERGDIPAVNVFLRDGHDPDAPGPHGNRPLHYAAYEGHSKVVELLLAGGRSDPNARNNTGITPLHNAAQCGHLECIASLVAAGGDVNVVDVDSAAPLHNAPERRAMEALLRAGADPNARRRVGLLRHPGGCQIGVTCTILAVIS